MERMLGLVVVASEGGGNKLESNAGEDLMVTVTAKRTRWPLPWP